MCYEGNASHGAIPTMIYKQLSNLNQEWYVPAKNI